MEETKAQGSSLPQFLGTGLNFTYDSRKKNLGFHCSVQKKSSQSAYIPHGHKTLQKKD